MKILLLVLMVALAGCFQSSGSDGHQQDSQNVAANEADNGLGGSSGGSGEAGGGSGANGGGSGSGHYNGTPPEETNSVNTTQSIAKLDRYNCTVAGGLAGELRSDVTPWVPPGHTASAGPMVLAFFELVECQTANGTEWLGLSGFDLECTVVADRCRAVVSWYVENPETAENLTELGFAVRLGTFILTAAPQEVEFHDGNQMTWRWTDPTARINVGQTACDEAGMCSLPSMTFTARYVMVGPHGDTAMMEYNFVENTRGREEYASNISPGTSWFATIRPLERVLEADTRGFGTVYLA